MMADVDNNHELVAIQGHPKYEQMLATVHLANQMALEKTADYDPAREFEGINITLDSGQVIENIDLSVGGWREIDLKEIGVSYQAELRHRDKFFYYQYLDAAPFKIPDIGFFNFKVLAVCRRG